MSTEEVAALDRGEWEGDEGKGCGGDGGGRGEAMRLVGNNNTACVGNKTARLLGITPGLSNRIIFWLFRQHATQVHVQ